MSEVPAGATTLEETVTTELESDAAPTVTVMVGEVLVTAPPPIVAVTLVAVP